MEINLKMPLDASDIASLSDGDIVTLSGVIYTARDAAHKKMVDAINNGQPLPFCLDGAAIYYCGPTPAREGEVIGSCGPTTSGRMDDFTPLLMENGLKVTIGKGDRSVAVREAIKKHKGLYLSAVGGAAALLKSCVISSTVVAYPELGCEAVHKLVVSNMPLIVSIDCH